MALDQNLALKGVVLYGVGAGVKQIGIAAQDFAVAEHDHSAALADASILQGDVNRIQTVFHGVPPPISVALRKAGKPLMPKRRRQRQRDSCPRITTSMLKCAVSPPPCDAEMTGGTRPAWEVGPRSAWPLLHLEADWLAPANVQRLE